MATNLISLQAIGVRACATSGAVKNSGERRRKPPVTNWWSPIFGWSSDADYIDPGKLEIGSNMNQDPDPNSESSGRSRFTPGCFTEEKAKQLRMMTKQTASFHDVMYHSAIASRLASDFSHRSDL